MGDEELLQGVRRSYDALAEEYAARFRAELAAKPLERALLTAFAEEVAPPGGGPRPPVADVGCGPGQVTAFLRELGVEVVGVDLSPGMVEVARRTHPGIRFEVGSMTELSAVAAGLGVPPGGWGGIVAFYSVIHFPAARLPAVFAEFAQVLAPGGQLLLGFQAGEGGLHLTEGFGRSIDLEYHWRDPDDVARLLADAGLDVRTRVLREPEGQGEYAERTPRAYVLARKPR